MGMYQGSQYLLRFLCGWHVWNSCRNYQYIHLHSIVVGITIGVVGLLDIITDILMDINSVHLGYPSPENRFTSSLG
jgi:hypothetical protein